jgi:hypothetical protein
MLLGGTRRKVIVKETRENMDQPEIKDRLQPNLDMYLK